MNKELGKSEELSTQELKKLKGKSQSFLLIYGFLIAFFLYVGIKSFIQITSFEALYNSGIPESELRNIFTKSLALNVYKSVGKWGFLGMFIGISIVVYFAKIKGHFQNLKTYNKLLNQ